jgi:hypothetical protein
MSYCRWSSDGWRSDVYVYEDVSGGWTTHVAGRKRTHPEECPKLPWDRDAPDWEKRFTAAYEAERKWVDESTLEPIGLPHDGESFNDPTPGDCADRLEALRALGYHVPQHAIDTLRAEAEEKQP